MYKRGNALSLLVLIAREAWSYNAQALLLRELCKHQCSIAFELFTVLPGGQSDREPPNSIPNLEVKPVCANGSAGPPRVRVGHRQASIRNELQCRVHWSFFYG